jgi:hypothetical protein
MGSSVSSVPAASAGVAVRPRDGEGCGRAGGEDGNTEPAAEFADGVVRTGSLSLLGGPDGGQHDAGHDPIHLVGECALAAAESRSSSTNLDRAGETHRELIARRGQLVPGQL